MAGGGVVRFGVKMIKMVLPVVKEVQSLGCESSQGNQILLSKVFRKLVEKIWERVGGEDVRERIKQLREEYEKWRKEREEECEKWWKDAEEEEAAEEKEEKAEKEEEEAERDDIEEEEEEEETKWSKMDEVMEHICEAGDPLFGKLEEIKLSKTAQAHARILKSGAHNDGYISAKLIASYSNHSCFDDANLVLQSIPDPNVYSFSSLIYALTKAKLSVPSYRLFELVNRFIAQRVRASGLDGDGFVQGSLFHMYMRCGKMFDARKVFDRMRERRDVVTCSALLCGWLREKGLFRRSGSCPAREAVVMFQKMHHLGFLPDEVAVSSVLPSVGDSERLDIGRQIHGYVIKQGLFELMETGVCNACITGLSRNGLVDKAVEMFGLFKEKNMELNVVSWTSIIAGCAQNGKDIEALELFREMQVAGVKPNRVTIPSMLPACGNIAALLHGRSAHGFAMDGFVLPPFESNCVLKDKDIVCVKRKKEPLLEVVEEDSEENVCAAIEAEERAPGAMLLANEEFQKGTGGYESESEEDELEEIVVEKKTSKKRKASSKIISSKRKKCKLATTEESPVERECEVVVSKGNAVKKM
ncbi:hypothetical protein Bca52824_062529 [Brassica carinata]|uniref:Pentatricopeptide repeat-containing protein n=1 Tax=Brassica carinata TaxID=52824 RepID=A0A8X7U7C9_BRACI|nr:hypothetical protein Bca52824_062529 [Brassica carinata]